MHVQGMSQATHYTSRSAQAYSLAAYSFFSSKLELMPALPCTAMPALDPFLLLLAVLLKVIAEERYMLGEIAKHNLDIADSGHTIVRWLQHLTCNYMHTCNSEYC